MALNAMTPEEGLLRRLGYHVGIDAPMAADRRHVLERVFHLTAAAMPEDLPAEYLREWGEPDSWQRYRKLYMVITSLMESATRQSVANKELAIEHWTSDLEWFRSKFGAVPSPPEF
jgi:hypothetical protein